MSILFLLLLFQVLFMLNLLLFQVVLLLEVGQIALWASVKVTARFNAACDVESAICTRRMQGSGVVLVELLEPMTTSIGALTSR